MKKLIFASILFLISSACFAEDEKILVGKHYTQEEFARFQNYEVIYNFPLTERTIKIFATQKKSKKTVTPNPLSLYENNKFLVLYDKTGKLLDAVGMYMFSGTYYDSAYISGDAFCFKHHMFDVDGHQHRFVYADNSSLQFKYFDAEPWVSSILISGKYLLWSIEMDTNTVCRVDMTNGEKVKYDGYFPNVDFFATVNKNYLGCFQFKKKWYVITETEIVEVAEEPAHSERKRLDNFWVSRKWLPTEVSENIKSGNLELIDVVLKDTDLASLSKSELRILRNMIYAKHGYKFKSQDLFDFFSKFEWYKPRYSNVDAMLSVVDLENIKLIQRYENIVKD